MSLTPEQVLEKIIALKLDRKNLKAKFTRFVTYYTAHKDKNFEQLRIRLDGVEGSLEEFEKIQTQISLLQPEISDNDTEIENFEKEYYEHISKARLKLKEHDKTVSASNSSTDTSRSNTPSIVEVNYNSGKVNTKLPDLTLKTFSGNHDEWLTFCDSFKSSIHNNSSLNDIDKLRYLQSSLTGSALKTIEAIETTASNYKVAWKLLEEQYDDKRLIIQTHVKRLMELPSVNKDEYTINDLMTDIVVRIRALKSLDQPVDHWDAILIYVVTSRLDRYTHLEWERSLTDQEMPTFEELRKFIKSRHNSFHVVKTQNFQQNRKNFNPQIQSHSKPHTGKKTSLNSTNQNPNTQNSTYTQQISNPKKDYCNYCKGEHKIYFCPDFQKLSVDERISAAKLKGLCLNCLRKGHFVSDCTMPHCKKCDKHHNTFLHIEPRES